MSLHLEQSTSTHEAQASWWEWSVWVEGSPKELGQVREVLYTLHPTFPRPVRKVADRNTKFRLDSAGWGEFMVFATVKLENGEEVALRHWLSFGSKPEAQRTRGVSRPNVFLSSSAADAPFADDLQSALETEGIEVLRPTDAAPANLPVSAWLERNAPAASAAVVILSDKKSPWLNAEMVAFQERKIPIVPVLIGRAQVDSGVTDQHVSRAGGLELEVTSIARRIKESLRVGEAPHPMIVSTSGGIVSYEEVYSAILPYLKGAGAGALEGQDLGPATIAEISGGLEALRRAASNPDVMITAPDRAASLMQTFVAQRSTDEGVTVLGPKYGASDPRWAMTMARMIKSSLSGKAPWRTADPSPMRIPNRLRAAVFGSWATGVYGAPITSASISRDPARFDLVMHLGDTYYSGTEKEVREKLLGVWPQVPGALNRALIGNHEMYSGGNAYFDIALPTFSQAASYFALQNDHWILVALDTAYSDHDFYGEQPEWLEGLVARAGDRRVVLFTHHQPLSLTEVQGPRLVAKLARLLQEQRIFAWFWAHEHACLIYDRHPNWGFFGRCLGFGGVPYLRKAAKVETPAHEIHWIRLEGNSLIPGAALLDGPNAYIPGHEWQYGPHGYAVLEFEGGNLTERIMLADGTEVRASLLI
jgi:hypothetical protein